MMRILYNSLSTSKPASLKLDLPPITTFISCLSFSVRIGKLKEALPRVSSENIHEHNFLRNIPKNRPERFNLCRQIWKSRYRKWVGLILVWIQQNNSLRSNKYIQSNKYLVSELRNSIAWIFSILLFITCVYFLSRIPSPIFIKKLKKTEEMEERREETDVEIETTPETKGTFMIEVSILVSTGVETVILLK